MSFRGMFRVLLSVWIAAGVLLAPLSARAASNDPPGPDRYTSVPVSYTEYLWWILRWEDNEKICEITADHEGIPFLWEIYRDCGEAVYDAWISQPPCPPEILEEDSSACPGYYIHLVKRYPAKKEISVALPPPVVWLTLDGCIPEGTTNRCPTLPSLILVGDEPLAGEYILRIEGTLDGEAFSCKGERCELPLFETGEESVSLRFWAYSSYGDSSEAFSARIRVAREEGESETSASWYADILSAQWRGNPEATCAETWEAFPPLGGPPAWLETPTDFRTLETSFSYANLAGNLIRRGIVDASSCADGGVLENGNASPCGVDAAYATIVSWQNRFDSLIFSVAKETGVSARLLKNLFARESQFWPGASLSGGDAGFGQMTEEGADTALRWNPIFYEQFCPLVLPEETCRDGYLRLDEEEQSRLRSALVYQVNAGCDSCPMGVDISQANRSIEIFAHALLANCEQTGQILRNLTGKSPGDLVSYEDLWRFALINYNAGAGCLSLALEKTYEEDETLDWEHVSENLTPVCAGAKAYVEDIQAGFSH